MPYSTISDVRGFGVTEDVSDARITAGLAIAKQRIDSYTGKSFAAAAPDTVIIDDVASPIVALPPFVAGSITAISVNNLTLDTTQWEERDFGVRLLSRWYFDPDGFLLPYDSPMAGSPFRSRGSVKVTVSATFGTPADETIALCSTILAAGFARLEADDALPPSSISQLRTEEMQIIQGKTSPKSTGNLEVDNLLDDYLYGGDLLG